MITTIHTEMFEHVLHKTKMASLRIRDNALKFLKNEITIDTKQRKD